MTPDVSILARVGLWFGCVALAAAAFALLFAAVSHSSEVVSFFEITMIFALAGAFLYLPVVIAFKNADGIRFWLVISLGILISQPSFALFQLFELIQRLRGINHNDPEVPSAGFFYLCAAVVGLLASTFYGLALKLNSQANTIEQSTD